MRFARLVLLAALVAGCGGTAATPIVYYVTPPPAVTGTAPSVPTAPTPTPTAQLGIVVPCPQGVICFGTGIDEQTGALVGPTNTFEVGGTMAWITAVSAYDGNLLYWLQVSRVADDGTETLVFENKSHSRMAARDTALEGQGPMDVLLSSPGSYVQRISIGPYIQNAPPASPYMTAEGRFRLVQSAGATGG